MRDPLLSSKQEVFRDFFIFVFPEFDPKVKFSDRDTILIEGHQDNPGCCSGRDLNQNVFITEEIEIIGARQIRRETCHSFEVNEFCLTNLVIIVTFLKIFVATFSSLHPRQCSEDSRKLEGSSLKFASVG